MTPQQLIDMPGAGSAERWLRKNGKWRLTPTERAAINLERAQTLIGKVLDAMENQE